MSFTAKMPAHRRTRREGRTSHGESPRRGHRHGGHSSSPSLSLPRDEANSRPEPAIAASVHAPAAPQPVPVDQAIPAESPTPEALQAFKAHWETQGRQPTYQEWLDFMQYWNMFGGRGQAPQVPNLVSPSVPVAIPESGEGSKGSQTLILSKMVKEARQLGCSTFEGTSDAIVAKQWQRRW